MESDRTAVFLVEAHVRGLIDFREARLNDPAWWRRLRAVFKTMAREKDREIFKAVYDLQLALVANGSLTEESFDASQERANELKTDLISTHRPWEGKSYQERQKKQFKDWRQRYIDAFGVDPTDEKFKEWEASQIAKIESGELFQETESDEERVTRLLRERDEKQRQGR